MILFFRYAKIMSIKNDYFVTCNMWLKIVNFYVVAVAAF